MPAFLHHLTTRVPAHACSQEETRDRLKTWTPDRRQQRLIHALYARSGIDRRHSVLPDFNQDPQLFQTNATGQLQPPGTASRNTVYAREAPTLAVDLIRDLLSSAETHGTPRSRITHLIFASCTGFTNPGPDYQIIRQLGLSPSVQRYTLGFMGCYAAFPALRMAAQFCQADPTAVVLVVCLELCTLHMQLDPRPDTLLANSLFADGAAACLVTAEKPTTPGFELHHFATTLVPASESEMAWDIGDHGFNLVLSSYVPDILGNQIAPLLATAADHAGWPLDSLTHWAVHPGGRAILDRVSAALHLPPDALAASRHILRHFGNMSSPTILFVLQEMLRHPVPHADPRTCALAFGPGLTVETAFLKNLAA
jgi:predicted naringenin-chalcone synthase